MIKTSFGRHESFGLRYSWLTKGFQAFSNEPKVFSLDSATMDLGVGKNMVSSIRFWLLAAQLIENTPDGLQTTSIGELVFGENGFDPYLEDEATIWLMHWLIASNSQIATCWFWFFNHFHKAEFEQEDVISSLIEFCSARKVKVSTNTLKQDISVLLRMYARSDAGGLLEETLDSPLSLLKLVRHTNIKKIYFSYPEERDDLALSIFGFAILETIKRTQQSEIPIEDLMYTNGSLCVPGAVFRLSENALITKLEKLAVMVPGVIEIRETAGIHQLYLLDKTFESSQYLEIHYKPSKLAEVS